MSFHSVHLLLRDQVDSNQSTEEVMQQFAKVLAVPVKSLQDHNVLFRKDPLQVFIFNFLIINRSCILILHLLADESHYL